MQLRVTDKERMDYHDDVRTLSDELYETKNTDVLIMIKGESEYIDIDIQTICRVLMATITRLEQVDKELQELKHQINLQKIRNGKMGIR